MIKSFRSKTLRRYFETGRTERLPVPAAARVGRILAVLDDAMVPEDLNLPGYYFHRLQGVDRWSVRVTANYRITFGWDRGAIEVDIEDYH